MTIAERGVPVATSISPCGPRTLSHSNVALHRELEMEERRRSRGVSGCTSANVTHKPLRAISPLASFIADADRGSLLDTVETRGIHD